VAVVERRPVTGDGATAADTTAGNRRGILVGALVAALVAVGAAVLLPVAPVQMSMPTVNWPQDPATPRSTMLELTNQTPLSVDVRFSCSVVAAAGGTSDGVVFATMVPTQPTATTEGMVAQVRDGRLTVTARGEQLVDEVPPAGNCSYALTGADGVLTATRDGDRLGSVDRSDRPDAIVLPDVDVLATSVPSLSPAAGDELRAELVVDDQFNTTPGVLKQLLVGVLLLAVAASFLLLRRLDLRVPGGPAPPAGDGPRSRRRVPVIDVLVPATMVLWLFLAPMSDDDGYYAAMARNASSEGYVGNYYQLLNQSFTPFTWFYRVLDWWQNVGDSPVVLRVPALVVGLLSWFVLRRFTARDGLPSAVAGHRWGPAALRLTLAAAFLAWWLPYGMGVRPEALVGGFAVLSLLLVATGLRRRRLTPLACAFAVSSLAAVCHPTGFVALAPVLAGLPATIELLRQHSRGLGRWTRAALLLAPGALASAVAFSDGTLHDFIRGQEIFLSIQEQNDWYDEYQRYDFLFRPIAMGSYARRAAVLLGLLCLAWYLLVAVAARVRRYELPPALVLAAHSLGLGFLLLWITPSKWTHHFGALSGLGPAFLALFLVSAPVLVQALTGRDGIRWPAAVAGVGSFLVVFALAFHGPNDWAYSWLLGMPHPLDPPYVAFISFDSLAVWVVGFGLVAAALGWLRRRAARGRGTGQQTDRDAGDARPAVWLQAVPALALVFLLLTNGYLLGSFSYAALRTLDTYSPQADALQDPLGEDCGPARALQVHDVEAATALPAAPSAGSAPAGAADAAFAAGAGWSAGSPPPAEGGIATRVWGSLVGPEGEERTGRTVTPWSVLPAPASDTELGLLAAGRLAGDNALTVEYGSTGAGGEVDVVDTQVLDDEVDSPVWRTFLLDPELIADSGAEVVRLSAEDGATGTGGWLAFTGPASIPTTPLREYLPRDAAVATAWQFAFLFPCQRQPVVASGITEPVSHGVVWGDGGISGVQDNTWSDFRGGLFAPVQRTSAVTQLIAGFPSAPDVRTVQVYRFQYPYPERAYELTSERVGRAGWAGP
jgi:hypothetical protein